MGVVCCETHLLKTVESAVMVNLHGTVVKTLFIY